jgi:single-strand selective monofunctional uracil DNA glycosylase
MCYNDKKTNLDIQVVRVKLIEAAQRLGESVSLLKFSEPVVTVYNPLEYAWEAHEGYLKAYGNSRKRVVFLGMNPGPWGMAQTGVPFGEIHAVSQWLGINYPVGKPEREHPKRPVTGLNCLRSEVSGRRFWGLFKERFGQPGKFFKHFFVANYCPLMFIEQSGRNRTPDKLKISERAVLFKICDQHLREVVDALQPKWVIGVGCFTQGRARLALGDMGIKIGRITHPSPANPAANRDWAGSVVRQLATYGIWL